MSSNRQRRCNKGRKVVFSTELEAKMALAQRVWKDKGEKRYYPCYTPLEGKHFHLTSQDTNKSR